MSEIEKLYENAGVKPTVRNTAIGRGYYIEHQTVEEYPPFTPEKQLELIKFLSSNLIGFGTCIEECCRKENFEEALAERINRLWQNLTEEACKQIKEILE